MAKLLCDGKSGIGWLNKSNARNLSRKGEIIMQVVSCNRNSISSNYSAAKICNIPLPDYNGFHYDTRTPSKMSEQKYEEAIVRQAQKDAATGKYGVECPGFKSLMKSYVSVVSPDRKGIIENALSGLSKVCKSPEPETISLLEILLGIKATKVDAAPYAEFKDSNGELVATYSNSGWTFFSTKAETARTTEFDVIYHAAWNAARNDKDGASIAKAGSFDVVV